MTDEELAIMANFENDPELAAAMVQSMREEARQCLVVAAEPPKDADPNTITTLQIRCPDGSRLLRRFLRTSTIGDVINFVKKEKNMAPSDNIKLGTTFPKRVLEDFSESLAEIGLGKQESLNVVR